MAYNSISTPRFYIDYFTHWLSSGLIKRVFSEDGTELIGFPVGLEPANAAYLRLTERDSASGSAVINIDFNEILQSDQIDSINYIAVLGHSWDKINILNQNDLSNITGSIRLDCGKRYFENSLQGQHSWRGSINREGTSLSDKNILNTEACEDSSLNKLLKSGVSIYKASIGSNSPSGVNSEINPETGEFVSDADISSGEYSGLHEEWNESLHGANIDRISVNIKGLDEDTGQYISGSDVNPLTSDWQQFNNISMGHYYDMPHSPDLKLTMDIQFDGSDTITTTGGSNITNIRYQGNPKWGSLNCWEVGESKSSIKRNGRRTWNLKFSYLSENDLFSSNYMSNTYMENNDGYKEEDLDTYNWSQNQVTNGSFASDASWNKNSNWTISGGKAVADGSTSNDINQTSPAAIAGNVYMLRYTISTLTSGGGTGFKIRYGGVDGTIRTATGTYDEIITATSTDRLKIYASGNAAGTIDDVSVQVANPTDFINTLADDNSFFAKVINYVGNGERFVFQPDNTANNPSDFAICVLDQKSLKISQVAFRVYDISLKIKEVW